MSTKRKPQSRNPAGRPGGQGAARAGGDARDDSASGASTAAQVSGAAKAAAVGLWGVVGVGLVYGISQTAVKVVALFG